MITDAFDPQGEAVITPELCYGDREPLCDACIVTFSTATLEAVRESFPCRVGAEFESAAGNTPIYLVSDRGREVACYLSRMGSAGAGACIQEARCLTGARRFFLFGTCGCLDRSIPAGTAVVPTWAYRDEGFSYHYAPPGDYIQVRNADRVAAFFEEKGLPCAAGRTWTTDAMYRETRGAVERRRAEGCVSVEMECAGAQAVCDFLGLELYCFFINGDLLDGAAWDRRIMGSDDERRRQLASFCAALELSRSLERDGGGAL